MQNNSTDSILITDYDYELPDEAIAHYPVNPRDSSKLLVYQNERITLDLFYNLDQFIPHQTMLVVNNSKVIEARLLFENSHGAKIEIFCLQPYRQEIQQAMMAVEKSSWHCMIGGLKKWKESNLCMKFMYDATEYEFHATKGEHHEQGQLIHFSWNAPHLSFAEVLHIVGHIPLPPYIKRQDEKQDQINYQTVYAEKDGSVAAPTAGLHFTERVFEKLSQKQIKTMSVTLHVGAGTFMPVKTEKISEHVMHAEFIEIDRSMLTQLKQHNGPLIAVGTTSQRTLESIYWMGVKALAQPQASLEAIAVQQWDAYQLNQDITKQQAIEGLETWMSQHQTERLFTQTQLIILPNYTIRMTDAIITNFHQPKSTLLLLISAFVGDAWRDIYSKALDHGFRFLSYGDSSLLWKKK